MALTPWTADQFGGLNLATDPFKVGATGATDMLNVDVSRGWLRTRPGTLRASTASLAADTYHALYTSPTNGGEILAVRRHSSDADLYLDALLPTNTLANIGSVALTGFWTVGSFAALGTATGTLVYITLGQARTTGYAIVKYNGTTVVAGTGKPAFAAVMPGSNRLAQANFVAGADSPTGANGSASTVFFSDPSAPDTFSADDWVALQPGDGEGITAAVSWQDMLFVFKQTNVFIFYGESTDSDGAPIFNYRRVSLPDAIPYDPLNVTSFTRMVAAAGRDGVYFAGFGGIYRTTGDTPVCISERVHGMFTSDPFVSSSLRVGSGFPSVSACGRWLIVDYPGTGQLVQDALTGEWMLWDLPLTGGGTCVAGWDTRRPEEFFIPQSENIGKVTDTATTDWASPGPASPIPWSYKSGRYSPADPGRVAVVPYSSVVGSGTVTLALDSDLYATQSAAATLGTAPAVAEGWPSPVDQEGTWLQYTLSGSASASVNRLTHDISAVKPAGVR